MESIIAALALSIVGYLIGSVKIINEGNAALIERLGRYHKTLYPGVNLIIPFLDRIVLEDTLREQVLQVEPQRAITRDNVSLEADAVVYWRILELERSYYAIEDIEAAIQNLVLTTLRSEIGRMSLEETFASRTAINQALVRQLDEATAAWGVKIIRVEVQNIAPARTVLDSMEMEKAAEIKKRAQISEAQGTVESIRLISDALQGQTNSNEVLRFLLAQRFVEANLQLGQSDNSKVVFMDPRSMTESVGELLGGMSEAKPGIAPPNGNGGNGGNGGSGGNSNS